MFEATYPIGGTPGQVALWCGLRLFLPKYDLYIFLFRQDDSLCKSNNYLTDLEFSKRVYVAFNQKLILFLTSVSIIYKNTAENFTSGIHFKKHLFYKELLIEA